MLFSGRDAPAPPDSHSSIPTPGYQDHLSEQSAFLPLFFIPNLTATRNSNKTLKNQQWLGQVCSEVIPAPLPTATTQKASGSNRRPALIHPKTEVRSENKVYTVNTKRRSAEPSHSITKQIFQLWFPERRKETLPPTLSLKVQIVQRMLKQSKGCSECSPAALCSLSPPHRKRDSQSRQAWQDNTNHPIQFLCVGATTQQQ